MDAVAVIAEVLTWVGLPTAALFGVAALILRMTRGGWATAPAVVADGEFRWMADDGTFHSAPASTGHASQASDDDFMVHYRTRRPDVCYLEPVAHDERTVRVVAISLGAVGVVALVVNTVATLMLA